ncbi:hypothetical protein GCM10009111_13280 [Colwellia asteriadis]|uniref:GP-PDE domain-containing protein n=1 Tax=Colwellia asteriadis TaxID=517723 RepID=A0ABP3WET8_9GAMM
MNNKIIKYTTVFLLLLLSSCGGDKTEPIIKRYIESSSVAKLISHRGYNNNQLNGFYSAIKDGFTRLEVDVRLRNGQAVLLHDDIDCANCSTLIELLDLAQNKAITLFIEFKELEAIEISLELLNKYNVDIVLTSFQTEHLKYLNAISNHSLGFVTNEHFNLENLPSIDYLIINRNYIDKCLALIKCVAFDVSNQNQLDKVKYKVDYVIIDNF